MMSEGEGEEREQRHGGQSKASTSYSRRQQL